MLIRLKEMLQGVELHKSNMSKPNFLSPLAFLLYQPYNILLPFSLLLSICQKGIRIKASTTD
jgi:hypothetical protein